MHSGQQAFSESLQFLSLLNAVGDGNWVARLLEIESVLVSSKQKYVDMYSQKCYILQYVGGQK